MLTDNPLYLDPKEKIFVLEYNHAYMCVCSTLELAGKIAKARLAEAPWLLDQYIDIFETVVDAPISAGVIRVWSDGHTSPVEPQRWPHQTIEEAHRKIEQAWQERERVK